MTSADLRFSREEIECLQRPGNRRVMEKVTLCLDYLGDLVRRYTGSMFLVMIPEEELAVSYLEEAMARLPRNSPFKESIRAGHDAYRRVRTLFEDQGLSPAVKELAQATADDLLRMWCWATSQPGFQLGVDERGWTCRTVERS